MTFKTTNYRSLSAALAAILALAACGGNEEGPGARPSAVEDRGELVSSKALADLDAKETAKTLREAEFDAGHVSYGVRAYRLVYRTVGIDGEPTTASGVIALPVNDEAELRVVSYTHGTTTFKKDVASEWQDSYATSPALMYASAGYAVAMPDYIGLGKGPGVHPWMHMATQTSASLDMLGAAREFAAEQDRSLERKVYVTGFSQGASSALGLARALQEEQDSWFGLEAVAPISGAYDFAGIELPGLLAGKVEPRSSVAYTALMLASWDRSFDLYDDPRYVFEEPYAGKVAKLFDGTTPGDKMMATLPGSLDELLTPEGRELVERPRGNLTKALIQADAACDWAPAVPVQLYVAEGDEQALPANTASCLKSLEGTGATAVNLGTPEHFGSRHIGSNVAGTAAVLDWFLHLEKGD